MHAIGHTGQVGQVTQVGQVGQVGQAGQVGQVRQVGQQLLQVGQGAAVSVWIDLKLAIRRNKMW